MKVRGIDHIGIAVKSIQQSLPYYRDVLGLEFMGIEEVPEQRVRVAFLRIGESRIELLEATSPDSPIAGFIEKRGGGIHHLAVAVDDIDDALVKHREAAIQLIDNEARAGAHGMKIAFVHPKSTSGVLVELSQPADEHSPDI